MGGNRSAEQSAFLRGRRFRNGRCTITYERWPIVTIRWDGPVDAEPLAEALRSLRRAAATGEQKQYHLICVRNLGIPGEEARDLFRQEAKAMHAFMRERLAAEAFVVESALIHVAIRGVYRFVARSHPVDAFRDEGAALEWLRSLEGPPRSSVPPDPSPR